MTTAAPQVVPATENQRRAEALIFDLWNDPEYGPKIQAAAKKKFGDAQTMDDSPLFKIMQQETTAIKAQLADALDRLNKRDEKDTQEKSFKELEASVDAAVRKYGLTDEGKAKMLDRMKESKIFDADVAGAWVAHSTPPTPPTPTWKSQKLNLFGSAEADESWKKLHTNPDGFLEDELEKFTADPDKYVAEAFGRAA